MIIKFIKMLRHSLRDPKFDRNSNKDHINRKFKKQTQTETETETEETDDIVKTRKQHTNTDNLIITSRQELKKIVAEIMSEISQTQTPTQKQTE